MAVVVATLAKRGDDVTALRSDLVVIKWMVGCVLSFQVAFAFKIVGH